MATLQPILQKFNRTKDPHSSRKLHLFLAINGLDSISFFGDHLIRCFKSCSSLPDACRAFLKIWKPSVYTWNAILSTYSELCKGIHALWLFEEMMLCGKEPEKPTFLCALRACASIGDPLQVYWVHDLIIKSLFLIDLVVESALIDAYAKCGRLIECQTIFNGLPKRDIVSWDALISGYVQHGDIIHAFKLLEDMQEEGISPDEVSFLSIMKAWSGSDLSCELGRLLHHLVIKSRFESNITLSNSLVDMYAKCGNLMDACKLFNELEARNVVSCTAMISGYVEEGEGIRAFEIFEEMQENGIHPDRATLIALLKACGMMGTVCVGRLIHETAMEIGLHADVSLGNTFVDMYAKCGSLMDAYKVFEKLLNRDMVSWHAIISGYAQQGNYMQTKALMQDMLHQGLKLDDKVFMSALASYSYVGLLDIGHSYFKSMRENHKISPTAGHYNCMVDLLGRVGCLMEAQDVLQTLPVLPGLIGWSSLLSGCKTHGNIELGKRCFTELFQLDFRDASSYMIMLSIFSNCQTLEDSRDSHYCSSTKEVCG